MKKKKKGLPGIILRTFIALIFSAFFLIPIVLTITNSFMSETEISSNYGQVFCHICCSNNAFSDFYSSTGSIQLYKI